MLPLVASASIIPCTGTITWATISTPGWQCEAGNLIYSNFQVVSGTVDPDVIATFSNPSAALGWSSTIDFRDPDAFKHNFQISFNVLIDPAAGFMPVPPAGLSWAIIESSTGLQDNNGGPLASFTAVLTQGATGSNTTTYNPPPPGNGSTTSTNPVLTQTVGFKVTDTFSDGDQQSKVFDVSNEFTQAEVPEPSTMLLLGGAFIGLGVIGRKRRKSI